MESFFSRCNKILRYYAMPAGVRDKTANEEKETKSHAATTFELRESYASTSSFSSALGVRRLVYSFAPCDCYHLVTDENNPLYYAKSSRAAYDARTVSITLVSDLTAAPWSSPTISISSHPNAGTPNERGGKTTAGGGSGGLEGLVFSNQASRAASPDPIVSGKKSSTCTGRSLSPQPIRPQNGKRLSGARTSLQKLTSKTDGFLTLTTSLSCNNVSGNPKHRKDSLLEKGLFGGKEHEESKETDASNGVSNRSKHALSKGDFANIFCLLSNSSAAQHQLRHGVIRPVVSVAVLDREKRPLTSFLKGDNSDGIMCHGLLDHTWYSIPVQPLPAMQDDVQWMPVVFGSTECISDVGYRTAMQIGFFPNKTDTTTRNFSIQQMTSGVLPTLEEARSSLAAAQEKKSALAPRDPNLLPTKQQNKQCLNEVALSSVFKKETPLANNEQPANVTARRGGVAMTFGNDEQPASVTARRGGVAMTFGNDEQPANVTARRGGVAMTFGNDEQPASVTARRGGVAMTFGNDEQPASVTARRGGVAMTFGNDEQPANVTARRGGVAMTFGNDEQPASVTARRGGVAMTFGNDEQPANVTARRGGVAMTFGNDEQPANVTARRGGVAMTFGNDEQPANVTARRGGVAMTFGNDEQPANVTARRGGVAMTFGNDEQPANVTARRGGVAMTFGNDEQPANVTARRGGVAMTFGNDEQPANVTARRGGVAMTFGNDEQPASVTARRGGVAMTFGNDEQPASVTARRGGVAMTFGNDEQPANVTARRGGVAMTFGNDEQPASVTARRGGVAMTFGNDEQPANVTARRGELDERDRMYGRKTGVECFGGDFGWRRSASYRSPKAQRPTIFERGGFALGEPESAVANEDKISTFFSSTARPYMKNISPRPFCRTTGMAPPEDICGGTPVGRWRASSPGPTFGESGAGQVLRNGGDWRPNAQRRGAAREDSPVPGFTGLPRSRATTVLDPFGKLCNRPSPHPTVDAPFQQMAGESHFYPSQNDRWQSHDVNNGLHRTRIAEHRDGSFWRPTSFGGPPPNGTSDPLASPISSISRSGLLMYEDNNASARGGFGGNFTPDAFHRFSHRPTVSRLNTGIGCGRYDTTNVNHHSNSAGAFADSGKRVGAGINSSFNSPFARTGFLYDDGVSRLPIIDEYGSPRNGSRVRPRGVQAMDIAWSGQWASSPAPSRSAHDIPGRRAVPYPVTSRVASIAMPWRNTTTTGAGVNKRGLLASKPPLAPSSRAPPFCFSAKPAGVRGTVTPSSVRGLTLRERVRLRQQQLRREANLQAVNENLHENYCMGNDMKRLRKEPNGFISEKACPDINASGEPNVVTGNTTSVPGATAEAAHNGDTRTAEKQGAAYLGSYGEQVRRLESLTEPFIQADGVNVSFCLRDLANVFLCLPGGALKESDLTKAAWLDDGVSYFVSAKPMRFRGGWESYLQHLNLYQQPFYLRERAFIFVLRVPYHPNLRVCVAVHNLDDFIALLQQRPLKPILLTKEEKWMQERLYGTDSGGIGSQAQTNSKRVGFFRRLFQRLHITKIDSRKEETRDEAQQCGGWAPMTWRRRLALLRLHAEATLRGSAWKTFTTPLLTDPALLHARMSFLSNRTATYAAIRHRINTLQALAATMVTKQREGCAREQPRMIENRVDSEKSLPLASNQTDPLNERPLFPLEARTPATTTTASGAKNVKTKREPFRVDRVGDGSATALRRPHPALPAMQPVETSAAAMTRGVIEKRTEMQTKCRSTLAPYASSVSLSRPQSPTPASQSDPVGVPGQLLPRETKRDALIQVAENMARRNNIPNEISPPPMTTVLKFVSSLDQTEKQGQIFDGCSKQTSISCVTTPNPVFAGLLPTPTEIHRQGECFNISVSQLQQLLQWQWEYHQNCYEAFPLPVFCGALVTPPAAYFDLAGGLKKRNEGSGISPLSRSLLLALIKWGWLVPMDYKASREGTRLCFLSEDPLSSLFGLQSRMGRGTFCLCFLVFGMWRHQAMWLALLYIVYNLLQAIMRVIFGGFHRRPAALDSATSIAYLQSEAAVETMLEKRQFFRTQSLATRILRTQSFVQNVLSRAVMLMRGHSPFLSLIIGLEVLMTCLLILIYKYSVCHLLPNTHLVPGVMVEHLLQALGPFAWVWNSAVVRWCAPLILPSGVDGKTLGFLFFLYFFCFLLPWSPLRWMCRRTWELFLHDDALVRRPLLSF
ncbi:hypothetical protein, conserved [Trypanosoma cruzi]|uniref:Uncharacterized protein n=1 Tax=Trypanosoma cruzi (strain CL Brener) TaxID=353153 RepID=Q4CW59_TRYCC|nr:hypothetical protein, conserved [Trypanosoma cruzi]EAN84509.1 hypothetical protein, conserved [Trypanosoma cruzi]|eukprot:XP_806360.1 hypothetical protein [Trypanosoma cruzi strain CL Brener]